MTPRGPIFVEKARYRRRRMMDAVRVLPFLGLALWMVPLLWQLPGDGQAGAAPAMSDVLRYIFIVWLSLVLGALALWTWSRRRRAADQAEDGQG